MGLDFFRKAIDQTIRMVRLKEFDPDAGEVKILSTKSEQPITDMTDKLAPSGR